MAGNKQELKTKRLLLRPMTDEALRELIVQTEDADLHQAYGEMLAGCEQSPLQRLWIAPWEILLRDGNTRIGSVGFHGAPQFGAVELGYGIDEGYTSNGYATEASRALLNWAFERGNVYFILAEAGNAASLRVLEKLNFAPDGTGQEGPRYLLTKPASEWMSFCMCLGLCFGTCLGTALRSLTLPLCISAPLGAMLGLLLDNADRKKRTALWNARKEANTHEEA